MDSSTSTFKTITYARSISLPSRSHPITAAVKESLCRLRASEATTSSSSLISHDLSVLSGLYDQTNDMLQLPLTQQTLCQKQHGKYLEEILEGSLQLSDVFGATKNVLSLTKGSVQELASSLRRRKSGDGGLDGKVEGFKTSRKNFIKLVQKCLANLKRVKKNCDLLIQDQGHPSLVNMLGEAEAASVSVFESLLLVVSGSKSELKSFVSKLIQSKHVACEGEDLHTSEVEKIDCTLDALKLRKSSKSGDFEQVQNLQKQLESFESRIQELDEGVESLFRHLMRIRVSLFNILNYYLTC
ncbi:Protein BPS1, chloroplastic [Dillenia turbinata]|uniref:Protein BPS1, chloroplastic n=1 Tax=Dillenia turbinata TaxID=194707 RepID=A0AAN8W331_9MAGN